LHKVIKAHNKKDLYLVFEYMETDLHSLVGYYSQNYLDSQSFLLII
jgi:hypothetical protein